MAHFAQLDENNTVTQVIVVHNNEILDNGVESESKGITFCQSIFGIDTVWKQTSYNGLFRKNFAGAGFIYDVKRDAFLEPRPFASWVLNNETCKWGPPVPYPEDGKRHVWDDYTNTWIDLGEKLATPVETI
jgi:hypothetical protein